jgi:hypothetical protein
MADERGAVRVVGIDAANSDRKSLTEAGSSNG